MNIIEWANILESATPIGWEFVFSVPETIISYTGAFPLVFAGLPNEPMSFVSNFGLQTTYQQKVWFMIKDSLDSVGISRKDSLTPNRIIQLPLLQDAQIAMREFVLYLQNNDAIPAIFNMKAISTPRFVVNGGQVLTGYELNFELTTLPIC